MGPMAPVRVGKVHLESGGLSPLAALFQQGGQLDPQLEEELENAEETRADCQDEGDVQGEAAALLNIARIRYKQKLIDKAMAAARDAKALFREAEDKVGEAYALEFIAEAWDSVSAYDKAAAAAERARQQMKRVGDTMGEARMLFLVCQNRILPLSKASSAEDVNKATKAANEFLELARGLNDPTAIGSALCAVSQVHVHKEKWKDALACIDEALPLFSRADDVQNKASALLMVARIQLVNNSLKKSLDAVQESLQLFRRCQDAQGEKACIEILGKLREFEFRVDGEAAPLKQVIGQKVRCGALEWASSRG